MADYDFRGLSPIDFEALARDLLRAETGLAFTTFAVGADGGIDCRHRSAGRLVVAQCKHRPDASRSALTGDASKERQRFESSDVELPDDYYFITSADLSPAGVDGVAAALGSLVKESDRVWMRGRLNGILTRNQSVERRHFKLWMNSAQVFDRIVGSGEWERNESMMRGIKEHVQVWVHTPRYTEALKILNDNAVVLISGAPGVGKSTLAEMLLLTHWEAGFKVVKIVSDVSEAWKHLREAEDEKVIFYYDDFLGQTSSLELQKNEGSELGQFIRALRRSKSKNALLVMTTREQILNTALHSGDDRISRALQGQQRIRVELSKISRMEKARMLVNHLYFSYRESGLLASFADDIRYRTVIDHPAFNPRILESVVLLKSPPSVDSLYAELINALEHPDEIWMGSFQQLSDLASRIIINLAVEPNRTVPVASLERLVSDEDDPRGFMPAMKALEDTWIRIEASAGDTRVRLYDPSRRDFLLDCLESGPVFNATLRHVASLQQLEFLVRQRHPKIAHNVVEASEAIERRAIQLLDAALRQAENAERGRAARAGKFGASESYRERMRALISTLGILPQLPNADSLLEETRRAMDFLDTPFTTFVVPSSSDAFALATGLNDVDEHWAQSRAEDAAVIGVKAIVETQELREYAELDWGLRERINSDEIDLLIEQAFAHRLDEVPSQSEVSAMFEELDELEYLASELYVTLDSSEQRDHVNELAAGDPPGHRDAVEPLASPYSGSDSNEAIASLFGSLRIEL